MYPTKYPTNTPTSLTNNPTGFPTVPIVEHCIPDPICLSMSEDLEDNKDPKTGRIALLNYINDLDIPGGQNISTIFPSEAAFRFSGTHSQTNDLDFEISAITSSNSILYVSTTSLGGVSDNYNNFDFTITNDSKL